jgi:hypothetical protein
MIDFKQLKQDVPLRSVLDHYSVRDPICPLYTI